MSNQQLAKPSALSLIKSSAKKTLKIASWPARQTAASLYLALLPNRISYWPEFVREALEVSETDLRTEFINKTNHLEGDVIECGVWRGKSLCSMALRLKELQSTKRIHAYDSFEGLPDPAKEDASLAPDPTKPHWTNNSSLIRKGRFNNSSLDYLKHKIKRLGISEYVTLNKGWFQDTLPSLTAQKLSFVHLDCDIYDSYKLCLSLLYPRLVSGGYMLFDEYTKWAYPGATKALDEFFSDKPEKVIPCEKGRGYIQKQ